MEVVGAEDVLWFPTETIQQFPTLSTILGKSSYDEIANISSNNELMI